MTRSLKSVPLLLFAFLLAACQIAPSGGALGAAGKGAFVNARAIIIVRHADIDPAQKAAMGNRTPLLPAGEARARELAVMLRDAGINRVVTSSALRTQQTAGPLVQFLQTEKIDIKPEQASGHGPEGRPAATAPANAGPASEAEEVVDYLARTAKPTDVILVVHHHSILPSLIQEFSHTTETPIDDATEFDRAYVILPDAGSRTYRILRLRYSGRPSPPPR